MLDAPSDRRMRAGLQQHRPPRPPPGSSRYTQGVAGQRYLVLQGRDRLVAAFPKRRFHALSLLASRRSGSLNAFMNQPKLAKRKRRTATRCSSLTWWGCPRLGDLDLLPGGRPGRIGGEPPPDDLLGGPPLHGVHLQPHKARGGGSPWRRIRKRTRRSMRTASAQAIFDPQLTVRRTPRRRERLS